MILLPDKVIYNEGYSNVRITDKTFIGFTMDGILDKDFKDPYITLESDGSLPFYFESFDITTTHKSLLDYKYRINDDNILLFTDGLFNSIDKVDNKGLNVIEVSNNKNNYCILFSNLYESGDFDNVMQIENKNTMANLIANNKIDPPLDKFLTKFDFDYNRNKSYDQNIIDAVKYVFEYNPNLLNLHYQYISDIKPLYYTGFEIRKLIDTDGYVSMSRYYNHLPSDIIIFKNGLLYDKYNMKYLDRSRDYRFPVDILELKDTDIFEILYFTNIENKVYEIYMDSTVGDNTFIIDPDFDITQSKLFCKDGHNKEFQTRTSKYAQYEVGFRSERVDEDKVKFVLEDAWYYDKDLSLVSKREFRYTQISAVERENGYKLPLDFRFANDVNRYIVFVNNRRIDRNNFKITDVKPTRPFINISIYFNIILKQDDKIDIFYVPDVMEEVLISPKVNNNIAIVDTSKIKYGLDRNVYMLFLNGKKLNMNQIINSSANRILIKNVDSTDNLSIVKYIPDTKLLSDLFIGSDILSDILNNLPIGQFNLLYNNQPTINSDTGLDRTMTADSRVLYQIVNDFYTRPFISPDDIFLYDYETDDNIVKDKDGNLIFDLNS